jgi:LAS superfamily LD-carboxypeptidase LdcB
MQGSVAKLIIPVFILLLSLGFGLFVHQHRSTKAALAQSQAHLGATADALLREVDTVEVQEEHIAQLTASTSQLEAELFDARTENFHLLSRLTVFEGDNKLLQEQLVSVENLLGMYDKIVKTDRELLQKYSKIYFLNENYVPSRLATITPEYLFDNNRTLFVHASVDPYLVRLLDAASSSGRSLRVVSAHRSFGTQAQLKSTYVVTYGAGANRFSAEQGYSEHQLGTTLDFTTPALGVAYAKFESAPAYLWLTQNAHRYGFVLSYPKNNAYYQFEPWHWRFVGIFLATKLYDEGKHFYDMDQREIDTYLGNIFDPLGPP